MPRFSKLKFLLSQLLLCADIFTILTFTIQYIRVYKDKNCLNLHFLYWLHRDYDVYNLYIH